MAELKTVATKESVAGFLDSIEDPARRAECKKIAALMKRVTGERPAMWGTALVGFGRYHYRYDSGREGDWFVTGFSPRKQNLTLYVMAGFDGYPDLMARLGKYKTGVSCLYVKRLGDVDEAVLEELVQRSVAHVRATHGG